MLYLKFMQTLQKNQYFIFSLNDLLILFPQENKKTLQNQLTGWIRRGYLLRLKRNLYELADKGAPNLIIPDLYVANKLYFPSYVSLETALSIYNIIPEVSFGVTSITTNVTRVFKNSHGQFSYFSCRPKVYTGYSLVDYSGFGVYMAEKEKAVVDFLYFRFRAKEKPNFDKERLSKDALAEFDWEKVSVYCALYALKVKRMAAELKEYVRC